MIKAYFIGTGYSGCYYVRCLLPLIYNGWDGQRTSIHGKNAEGDRMFQGAMASDIVVFHRPSDINRIASINLLQLAGKKVVFDNDDTYIPNAEFPLRTTVRYKQLLRHMNVNLNQAIKKSDLVTTTTEFLAKEYRVLNPNVVVLPNLIDPEDWEDPLRNKGDKVRIGMVGSVLSNEEYLSALPAIKKLYKRDDVQLVILGIPKNPKKGGRLSRIYKPELKFWRQFDGLEWHSGVESYDYNEALNNLRLDIMLIPRMDSYFNRCKSNIKFLEASMVKVPVIAQGFSTGDSPYQGVEDSKYMKIVINNKDWMPAIEELIKDKEKRVDMGELAYNYVLENYNIHDKYHLWANAYKKLI